MKAEERGDNKESVAEGKKIPDIFTTFKMFFFVTPAVKVDFSVRFLVRKVVVLRDVSVKFKGRACTSLCALAFHFTHVKANFGRYHKK